MRGAVITADNESVYVFLDSGIEDGIVGVKFFLDGTQAATEILSPWELLGGAALKTADLVDGPHTVRAEVTLSDRSVLSRQATFTVRSS
ncbi:MAG: hypothetical protein WD029_09945 [Microthrixaceae bacterium]